MTTSDSAKLDSPYLEVPRHFTSISCLGRVPSVSWDDIVQETAAIFVWWAAEREAQDSANSLTKMMSCYNNIMLICYQQCIQPCLLALWPETSGLAPRHDTVQSRIM